MKRLLLAASLLSTTFALAQGPNGLQFQKGKKLEMTVDISSTTDFGMGSMTSKATVDRVFDINDVANGNAVIEHKIKRVQSTIEAPGSGSQKFDSENPKDLKGPAGKALEKIIKNKYTMTVDERGKVTAIKLDEDNVKAKDNADPQTQMILSLLSDVVDGMETPEVGDVTEFGIMPARDITIGESWTDTAGNRSTTYTLVSTNDSEIVLAYREKNKTIKSTSFGPMSINISLDDATEGRVILDKSTKLLKQKSATTTSTGTMDAMGQQAPVKATITKAWTVK